VGSGAWAANLKRYKITNTLMMMSSDGLPTMRQCMQDSLLSQTNLENASTCTWVLTNINTTGPMIALGNFTSCAITQMTSNFSKVYEIFFLNRLQHHFDQNNIINPQQHGFRKGKSTTVTALFDFAEQMYSSIAAREKLNVILYDFSNAFGTLYPQLLLRKLKIYGVTDDAISWLLCFLTERERYVQIRDVDCDGTEIIINSDKCTSDSFVTLF
jgi:hypothetical protein